MDLPPEEHPLLSADELRVHREPPLELADMATQRVLHAMLDRPDADDFVTR